MKLENILIVFISLIAAVVPDFCSNKSDGFYPDPVDCSRFYRCLATNVYTFICPAGLQYDVNINACNWAQIVNCKSGATTKKPTAITTTLSSTTLEPHKTTQITTTRTIGPTSTAKYVPAKPCDTNVCKLPSCRCSGPQVPNDMPRNETPKMVTFTMDDGITQPNYNIYQEFFNGKLNPNGCPVKTTYYVSGDYTRYDLTKSLYDQGHEIGVHTKTHRFPIDWWKTATYEEYVDEIVGMRTQLEQYGIKNLIGYRQPFLQTAGDTTFSVLKDYGFTYDTSLPTNLNDLWWPYTLDYDTTPKPCVIPPCPKNAYPGLWEISMMPYELKKNGRRCSMFDELWCTADLKTADEVYQYFKDNYDRHFSASQAPFPIYGHARWILNQPYRKAGLKRFLDELIAKDDVYLISMAQTIEWMKNPTSLQNIKKDTGVFSC